VHELDYGARSFTAAQSLRNVIAMSDAFMVPCEAVKRYLMTEQGVPASKLGVVNYYIPSFQRASAGQVEEFRRRHGITARFVVGGMGMIDWRKGTDVFIQVAAQTLRARPAGDVQFVWMGASDDLEYRRQLHDVRRLNLDGQVVILPMSGETACFFKSLDLFLMTSREDPYPLVVLEAASEAVPTVCFREAGGIPEFVEADSGGVVDYMDTVAMAGAVRAYFAEPELLRAHGENAQRRVRALHQDEQLVLNQVKSFLV
jgi:glycosyltransferase involved in cell wall biosynthesis